MKKDFNMYNLFPEINNLLLWCEGFAATVALIYFREIKHSHWKYFVYYLVYIFIVEKFSQFILMQLHIDKQDFHAYFAIPFEFIFFYWLYALKSLGNKKLFLLLVSLYVISFVAIHLIFEKFKKINSLNFSIGTLFLLVLVFLEYLKQIRNDNILEYHENKMFYINIGVVLFYVGALPFFAFYNILLDNPEIWNNYYLYFLVSNCIMYLLFAASFIWGKVKF